jgi:hypothetical protein
MLLSITILESLKLRFNLCKEKQNWQIALRDKLNQNIRLAGYMDFPCTWRK